MSGLLGNSVRAPRLAVLANGMPLAGVLAAEVHSNNHLAADRFRVRVALGVDPFWTAAAFAAQSSIQLDVQVAFDMPGLPASGGSYVSLILGTADMIEIDAISQTVWLEGRDLTSLFIASPTQESYANQTASQIATQLAVRQGLVANVAPTTTLVGRYYQSEHDRITLNQFSHATTQWDLLIWLAQEEGFNVWVSGNALNFMPAVDPVLPDLVLQTGGTPPVYGVANLTHLRMERSLTLARDIVVTVKSWNSHQQQAFTQTVGSAALGSTAPPQSYVLVRPNLTPDQALRLANRKLAELTAYERVIVAEMPGELSLDARSTVLLAGTGTQFDQFYFVDTIDRMISYDGGFTQHVRAKNASPLNQATPPADYVMSVTG
jgi:phage protein D